MFDLQVVAFQADVTRISTFMMSRELNSRTYPQIGVPDQHHSVSHHQYNPVQMEKHQKINTYHVQLFARSWTSWRDSPTAKVRLLDHTMILYGSGMGDGNVHSHDPISVLLGGGATGQSKAGPAATSKTKRGRPWRTCCYACWRWPKRPSTASATAPASSPSKPAPISPHLRPRQSVRRGRTMLSRYLAHLR